MMQDRLIQILVLAVFAMTMICATTVGIVRAQTDVSQKPIVKKSAFERVVRMQAMREVDGEEPLTQAELVEIFDLRDGFMIATQEVYSNVEDWQWRGIAFEQAVRLRRDYPDMTPAEVADLRPLVETYWNRSTEPLEDILTR